MDIPIFQLKLLLIICSINSVSILNYMDNTGKTLQIVLNIVDIYDYIYQA